MLILMPYGLPLTVCWPSSVNQTPVEVFFTVAFAIIMAPYVHIMLMVALHVLRAAWSTTIKYLRMRCKAFATDPITSACITGMNAFRNFYSKKATFLMTICVLLYTRSTAKAYKSSTKSQLDRYSDL